MKYLSLCFFAFTVIGALTGYNFTSVEIDAGQFSESQAKQRRVYDELNIKLPPVETLHVQKSPKGVSFFTEDTIPAVYKTEQFAAVEEAFERVRLQTKDLAWSNITEPSEISVIMLRATATTERQTGGLTLKDNRIVSGTIVSLPDGEKMRDYVVIAQNWLYPKEVRAVTRNHLEHLLAFHNCKVSFLLYTDPKHDKHPNFPLPDEKKWLVSPIGVKPYVVINAPARSENRNLSRFVTFDRSRGVRPGAASQKQNDSKSTKRSRNEREPSRRAANPY